MDRGGGGVKKGRKSVDVHCTSPPIFIFKVTAAQAVAVRAGCPVEEAVRVGITPSFTMPTTEAAVSSSSREDNKTKATKNDESPASKQIRPTLSHCTTGILTYRGVAILVRLQGHATLIGVRRCGNSCGWLGNSRTKVLHQYTTLFLWGISIFFG